jgi:hypothetical protein
MFKGAEDLTESRMYESEADWYDGRALAEISCTDSRKLNNYRSLTGHTVRSFQPQILSELWNVQQQQRWSFSLTAGVERKFAY